LECGDSSPLSFVAERPFASPTMQPISTRIFVTSEKEGGSATSQSGDKSPHSIMNVALVCDPPDAVLVHKPTWVADGFRAAGHTVRLVHDLAGVRAADAECDLLLFDHKASGMNRAALAELAQCRLSLRESAYVADFVRSLARGASDTQNSHEFCYAARPAVWAQWWRDLIAVDPAKTLAEQDYLRSFGAIMRGMDIVFVKERSLVDEYHALGINAYWLDQACPAEMPACEHHELPEWDVLVLGSPGYVQRRADARALADAGFRVLWAGMSASDPVPPGIEWHPWVHPLKLPELVSRCGVVLGVDWRSDLPGYTSDRLYLACGMGACYIARCGRFPCRVGPASLRAPAQHADGVPQAALAAWVYRNTDELVEFVRLAMSDISERRRRGQQSRRLVMAEHTYAHRAMEIINLVAPKVRDSIAQGATLGDERD
ncbi:MAG: glycosyltransferase family protein, partial [Pirellulales bacterium]